MIGLMTAPLTPKHINLADQRGLVESPHSGATVPHTLAPGRTVTLPVARGSHRVLLPVIGALAFTASVGFADSVGVEQVQVMALPIPRGDLYCSIFAACGGHLTSQPYCATANAGYLS